jgi:spermidine synthase
MKRFREQLYNSCYVQEFEVNRILFEEKTGHHHLIIFENSLFGRVMALDGIIQTTEKDEFIYHEMLAHVPLFAHEKPERVLIVGGGDGGILRETLRHRAVRHVTQVEIDRTVTELCREYLPGHSSGAFDDPRLDLVIDDGRDFVNSTDDKFDIIICDSTDPEGPGEALFSYEFYNGCKRCLRAGGVLVTQNGVCFMQMDEARDSATHFRNIFSDYHFFSVAVPTYVGGIMLLGWASDNRDLRRVPATVLKDRFQKAGFKTSYYNPEIHIASFMLPEYVLEAIGKQDNG